MDPAVRRRVMASIPKRNTRPEIVLRRALTEAGIRGYRCHLASLAGSPDVAFTRHRLAVFVDGVWWHGHPDWLPRGRRGPYWDAKIARNVDRDRRIDASLKREGWEVLRIWDLDILADPASAAAAVSEAIARLQVRKG
jgi:DNA mismatch endonuclease, patch repair protein